VQHASVCLQITVETALHMNDIAFADAAFVETYFASLRFKKQKGWNIA
jgi:hypothetical protein